MTISFLLTGLCVTAFAATQVEVHAASGDAQKLRSNVLTAGTEFEASEAYKNFFCSIGLASLPGLFEDEDTGIALHAAWEAHKALATRQAAESALDTPVRSEIIYDRARLTQFQAFVKKRTKAPIPAWWSSQIVDVDVAPGKCHAFNGAHVAMALRFRKSNAGPRVPLNSELANEGQLLRYSSHEQTLLFDGSKFKGVLPDSYCGLLGKSQSVLAGFSSGGGFNYMIAGLSSNGGDFRWKADVWATGRLCLAGGGFHAVELIEQDGTLFVFGAETHGMYLEAFHVVTGKPQYRFCTQYWGNASEAWPLK